MSRTSRNNMRNSSFFHIMVQGINKEYIFDTQKNKKEYLKLIYNNDKNIQIIAYCIMDNHAHILLQSNSVQDISAWMKKTNTSYAIYYNKTNNRIGYVFRERYKAQPIKNERHLYLSIEYIHNNPVKAKICNRKEEYKFSSYDKIYRGNQVQMKKKISNILRKTILQIENSNKEQEEKFEFLEYEKQDKQAICEEIINKFIQKKGYRIEELKNKEEDLVEIIKILKYENNISYRMMEKYFKISREKLRKLI